jgi:mono/diheme cytochrome c family protein
MADNEQPNPDYEHGRTDVSGVHAPVAREKTDPIVGGELPSLWVFAICGLILMLGTGIFMGHLYAPRDQVVDDRPAPVGGSVEEDPLVASAKRGKKVYAACMGCHQANGNGLPGMYPPLAGSEWVTAGSERLMLVIQHGLVGEIEVKGQVYNFPGGMPAQGAGLSDQKMADVMTYIRNEWGNSASMVTAEQVASGRAKHAAKLGQWTASELESAVPDAAAELESGAVEAAAEAAEASPSTVPAPDPAGSAAVTAPESDELSAGSGKPDLQQYVAVGKQHYMVCLACHQPTGLGIPNLYPPLAKSEWVNEESAKRSILVVLHGLVGKVSVSGQTYDFPGGMPAQGTLDDLKIAQILTYVRNEWGNKGSLVTPQEVATVRQQYKDRAAQWTEQELNELLGAPGNPN